MFVLKRSLLDTFLLWIPRIFANKDTSPELCLTSKIYSCRSEKIQMNNLEATIPNMLKVASCSAQKIVLVLNFHTDFVEEKIVLLYSSCNLLQKLFFLPWTFS